jgi:hypothetical protein
MSNLLERLIALADALRNVDASCAGTGEDTVREAAQEIERLENALRRIANSDDDGGQDQLAIQMWAYCRESARIALALFERADARAAHPRLARGVDRYKESGR